nr:hypothetical protein [Alphaproteobacteria bacterium]
TKTTINLIEKNLLNIINSIMQKHYSNFEFKDGDNSETRITLYLISENNCYAINRCSTNPTLQKIHGSTHQLNQGCIKWGYERGFHFDNNFPCPSTEPKKYKDYLRRRDKVYQYNFSNSDCKSIRNKCRIYGVQRISKNNKYFGLLVLESHKKHNFTEIKSKNSLNALSNELKDFLELHDLYISQISKETIKTETN